MDIREQIAELEHEQWIAWSKNIAETDNISIERAERWAKLWIPYSELTEDQKDQDRIWADKILALSGTTDIECLECEGNKGTDDISPSYYDQACPKCNGTGVIPYKWKVSVVLENGELPESPYRVVPEGGFSLSHKDKVSAYLHSQEDMKDAGYVQEVRQVVE